VGGGGGGTRDMKCEFGCVQPLSEGFYVDRSSGKGPVIYIYI